MGKQGVKSDNYYVVQGWMRNELGLKGNSLSIYAIIYGFSQTDHQEFTASINYLCEWLGVSRPTVINTLKDLVEQGLLTKESEDKNGVIYNHYRAVVPEITRGKEILPEGSKNFTGSGKKILPNNINNTKEDNKEKESIEKTIYAEIVSYLNFVVGSDYKASSKETQKHISARLKEGYTVSDFKAVIDVKYKEWGKDKKMFQYLRPSTLFGTKFESYLSQAKVSGTIPVIKREAFDPVRDADSLARDENGELVVF